MQVCRHTKYVTKSTYECANGKIVKYVLSILNCMHTYKAARAKTMRILMSKTNENEIESAEEISIQVM